MLWVGIGVASLLAVATSLVAARRWSGSSTAADSATAAASAATESPRRYSKPLMSMKDLEIGTADPAFEGEEEGHFKPRTDLPAWPLKLPLDWTSDPFKDGNWQAQLHGLRMVNSQVSRYEKTGDSRHYREALAFVLDWWRYHQSKKRPPKIVWEAMRAGLRAVRIAYVLDRALSGREQVSSEQQALLVEMARAHVTRLSDPKGHVYSNHGLFQVRGLAFLCRVMGRAGGCRSSEPLIEKQTRALLDAQFTQRGVHREHSPSYQLLAIAAFESAAQPNGTGVYKEVAERLERARGIAPWFVFPGGRMAALGDSEGVGTQEPPADQRCKKGAPAGCVEVGNLTQDGYAIVRSPWSEEARRAFMLIMTGTHNSKHHKHADDLSFELMEAGQMLFVEAGKYSYQRDEMRQFVISRRAHNGIGLANEEIGPNATEFHATALEPTEVAEGVYTLEGQVEYPDLFAQQRRVDYAPGQYVLIHDTLSSKSPQAYESYLHLAPELTPRQVDSAFMVPLAEGRQLRIESLSADCKASQVRGVETKKQVQGWVTHEYRKMVPASVLTFACTGQNRSITLLASFDAAARKAAVSRHARQSAADKAGSSH
jgi:hypothetical protein